MIQWAEYVFDCEVAKQDWRYESAVENETDENYERERVEAGAVQVVSVSKPVLKLESAYGISS